MAITELIFRGPKPAEIGSVVLDASVRELHSATAKASRHPIEAETGSPSDVSDNIKVDPQSITIDGVISGTPVEPFAAIVNLFAGGSKDPVKEAHDQFLETLLTGKVITVVTTLKDYSNMVLEEVKVTRDAGKGNALHFTATATQITLVTLQEVEGFEGQRPVGQSTKTKGSKAAVAAPEAPAKKTSALFKLIDGISALPRFP